MKISSQPKTIEFVLSEKSDLQILDLRQRLSVQSAGEVLGLALGTLSWLVDELEQGNQLLVLREPGKAVRLGFPHLTVKMTTNGSRSKK